MAKNILVLADIKDGNLRNVSLECLAAARQIASDAQITVALLGSYAQNFTEVLASHGANHLLMLPNEDLTAYNPELHLEALKQVIELAAPDVFITGHTVVGRDVTPRLAAHLGAGLISDCTNIETTGDNVLFTRPIYAGKAFAKKTVKSGMVMVTIRPNNIPLNQPNVTLTATSQEMNFTSTQTLKTIVQKVVKKSSGSIDLSEATIIVSGGRGVKSKEGFEVLQNLADVLGAAVGASRGACDSGYCEYGLQIGQTGKVVTPDLYIACGISGAIQHLAGMSNSKIIVAINKDPEAPIFQVADYGIVGDLFEVVPLLTEEFKQLLVMQQ